LNHIDLCVSSMERSLPFDRGLLAHLGPVDEGSIHGERGEVVYLNLSGGAVGLREAQSAGAVIATHPACTTSRSTRPRARPSTRSPRGCARRAPR
jgi:hypothetical protein